MGSKKTIGILIVVIVVLLGFAGSLLVYRNNLSSANKKNNSNNNTAQSLSSAPSGKSIENFYDKPITDEKIALDSIEVNRDKLGYSDKSFTFIYDEKSSSETAYHFDLYYKDIPVYGGGSRRGVSVITYHDNSPDVLITGVSDSQKITKVNTDPKITQDEALEIAKETLGENFSEYNILSNLKKVKVCPKLIIYETQGEYVLSYRIISNFCICIINAKNGDVITSHSTLVSKSAEYEGQRKDDIQQIFYDDVLLDDSSKKKNVLYCNEKNIFIYDDLKEGKFDFEKLLTLNDIDYGKNKSAVDAMANTYKAIRYFEKFGISLDAVHIQVNDTDELESRFPRKTLANSRIEQNDDKSETLAVLNFGTKDIEGRQYSAYLDVVAHEYTHCITNFKAFGSEGYKIDRIYFERNALMEAYSDVFGELIEQECTGDTDWKVADSSLIKPTFGSMYKYKYSEKRKTKDDEGTKENDYGYAHDNSTIISHTAYLMSKSNDSKKYDAEFLLDYNQLAQLWYGSLEYLKETEFMDFSDCRWAIEKSARKLIKQGVLLENNLKIIEQAFNEVEVISNPTRRGLTDSMEIIEDKNTIVVPIEDETQSNEFVEIQELNYTWHLDPTIEAEDIIVIDDKANFLENGYVSPYDECAVIQQNGKKGIIKYDGTNIAEPIYEYGGYDIQGAISVYNEYDQTKGAERVDVFSDKGELKIQINQERGWGYVGSEYLWINNKVTDMCGSLIFSGKYYDDDYNIVVQSAQLDSNKRFVNISNKYGIANKNALLVPIEYDKGYMHSYNNTIALCKGEKWTYFDENGKSIIESCEGFKSNSHVIDWWAGGGYNYNEEYILPYISTENYIPVKINEKCGYYDTKGNEVIPCGTFEEVRPVHNGLAWVKKDGKWGVIQLEDIEPETTTSTKESSSMETIDIYEGETITLSGTLSYEHYEINSNNSGEALILTLDKPFIAKYCKSEVFEVGTTENITSVQILSDNLSQFSDGQYVTLTGAIMNAHTGHHIRSIILTDIVDENTQNTNSQLLDSEILSAVNKYLEENQSHLGVWLSDSNAYCPAGHMYSNDTNWSCPIDTDWDSYSSNEMAGAYPHFAYVDKSTLKCTISANYETVVEFDLNDYIN